jgi:hypothetical protein
VHPPSAADRAAPKTNQALVFVRFNRHSACTRRKYAIEVDNGNEDKRNDTMTANHTYRAMSKKTYATEAAAMRAATKHPRGTTEAPHNLPSGRWAFWINTAA